MKKLKTFFCFIFLTYISFCSAQKDSTSIHNYSLRINPLQLITGEARLQLEKQVSETASIEVIASYLFHSEYHWMGDFEQWIYSRGSMPYGIGGKIGIGYKRYLRKISEKRLQYFNPILFYKYIDYKGWDNYNYYSEIGLSITDMYYHIASLQFQYGQTKIIANKILFDWYFGVGARYKYGVEKIYSSRPEVAITSPRKLESWISPSKI